ncbi:MAG: hypothetical protein ACMUIE_09485 [Thermoplasmatota archaeon]
MNLKAVLVTSLLLLLLPFASMHGGAGGEHWTEYFEGNPELAGHFTENHGQWDESLMFMGDTQDGQIALGTDSVYLNMRKLVNDDIEGSRITGGHMVALRFMEPSNTIPVGFGRLPHRSNYFLGDNPEKWVSGAPNYGQVVYEDLWEGIDLTYMITSSGPKYEYRLSPGSDISDIRITVEGAEEVNACGADLRIRLSDDMAIHDTGLVAYYGDDLSLIDASFRLMEGKMFGFDLGEFDGSRPVVIDPYLKFTYLGGNGGDAAASFTIDEKGSFYVTGTTTSNTFPTTPGCWDNSYNGGFSGDIFVTKINSTFLTLDYSTYLGGTGTDAPTGIGVRNGEVVICGETYSTDYPTSANAYNDTNVGWRTIIVTKLNSSGSGLLFSTLVDGKANESSSGLHIDKDGNVLVVGYTSSTDFPTTSGAYDRTANSTTGGIADNDVVIFKLNSQGSSLIFSTFYGGALGDIGGLSFVEEDGSIWIAGYTISSDLHITSGAYDSSINSNSDIFIARFNHNCSKLERSTYFGEGSHEFGGGCRILPDGDIVLVGFTHGTISTTNGAFDTSYNGNVDTFLARFDRNLTTLKAATYIGGSEDDRNPGIGVDDEGSVFVYGDTISTNFPTTDGADDRTFNGTANQNMYLAKLDGNLTTLMYGTYLGGDGYDSSRSIRVLTPFKVMLSGVCSSTDFKSEGIGYDKVKDNGGDGFLLELSLLAPPTKPRNLTFTRGDDWVHLRWEPPLSDGGRPIIRYEIWRSSVMGAEQLFSSVDPFTLEYNDTTIRVDDEWFYLVKAVNDIGPSLASNRVRIADDVRPWLGLDLTPGTAVSATSLTFSIEAFDNGFVDSVWLEYQMDLWGDTGYHNVSMDDMGSGMYEYSIDLPDEEFKIFYHFALNDTSDNWYAGPVNIVEVKGNIYPFFGSDDTQTEVKAGEQLKFSIEVMDNVGIEEVSVEFWSKSIYRQRMPMDRTAGDWFEYSLKTKRYSLDPIHYIFHAVDPSDHENSTVERTVSILDAEAPSIASDASPVEATTGDPFTFQVQVSDNQEVSAVWVEYVLGGELINGTMVNDFSSFYSLEITVPDILGRITYRIFAEDGNGNSGRLPERTVVIVDNDDPEFKEDLSDGTALCGERYTFGIEAEDNIEVAYASVEYWFGDGPHKRMKIGSETDFRGELEIPVTESRDLAYFFRVFDTSGNMDETDVAKVDVRDLISPVLISDSTPSGAGSGSEIEVTAKASDNIGMKWVQCIWSGPDEVEEELYLDEVGGRYTGFIPVPEDSLEPITYKLVLVDVSANMLEVGERAVQVIDTIPPSIEWIADMDVGLNTELNLEIEASDNIELDSVEIENSPLAPQGSWIKGFVEEPGSYVVRVIATDTSGNSAEMVFTITVKGDGAGAEDEEGTNPIVYVLPIISLIIMLAVLIIFFLFGKKGEKQELPPPPMESGAPMPPRQDDELERLFNASYGGENARSGGSQLGQNKN